MWAAQYYDFDHPRTLITSAGLGSMGYGYPSAIGAKVARPDKQVIDIDGDGSFVMNIQELACARVEGHRREGDGAEQSSPRHGRAVGGSLFQIESRPHLPRPLHR
jgi:hypothetical protein